MTTTPSFVLVVFLMIQGIAAAPSIVFDHPSQDFSFHAKNGSGLVIFAIRAVQDESEDRWKANQQQGGIEWQTWAVLLEVNAHQVGYWPAQQIMNALGEVKVHIEMGELPIGEHVATCRLVDERDDNVDIEHTVSFYVREQENETDQAAIDSPNGTWDPPMTEPCLPPPADAALCIEASEEGCGDHGVCVKGLCYCDADWAGHRCDHFLLAGLEYLPEAAAVGAGGPTAAAAADCAEMAVWESQTAALRRELESLGAAQACSMWGLPPEAGPPAKEQPEMDSDGELFHIPSDKVQLFGPPTHGLGFNVHYVSHMIGWGLETGRVPVMVQSPALGGWTYGRHPDCSGGSRSGSGGWECWFEPISACDRLSGWLHARGLPVHTRADGIVKVSLDPPSRFAGAGPEGRARHGKLWWRAQLVNQIVRPSAAGRQLLRQVANRLGLQEPYVSVHIRMGDSCAHAARHLFSRPGPRGCVGVEAYLNATRKMHRMYKVDRVYLATDDEEAVEHFRVLENDGMHISWLRMDRRTLFNSTWLIEHRLQTGLVDVAKVAQSTFVDLMLLSRGHYFVGSFGGHMTRLAYELMVARRGKVTPYVSVDRPWCYESSVEHGTGFIDFC